MFFRSDPLLCSHPSQFLQVFRPVVGVTPTKFQSAPNENLSTPDYRMICCTMLPIFPNARRAMRDAFNKELFRAMWEVSPILKEIRTRPQVEGHEASYQRESGEIIQIEYKK